MQLYFILPNFYKNFSINQKLVHLTRTDPECFKHDVSFEAQRGNFPFCCWNGGNNTCFKNENNFYLYQDIIAFNANSIIPTIFNCGNVLLTEEDYKDNYAHLILSHNANGSNKIEFSNIKLFNYLKNLYPQFDFVLSPEFYLLNLDNFTPEVIDAAIEAGVSSVLIPEHLSFNIDFLKQIKHKSKVSICINPMPCTSCENYINCKMTVHEQQIMYSKRDNFTLCNNLKHYEQLYINYMKYTELGFNHFYFSQYYFNTVPYEYFLIKFFIKPEFEEKVLTFLLEEDK